MAFGIHRILSGWSSLSLTQMAIIGFLRLSEFKNYAPFIKGRPGHSQKKKHCISYTDRFFPHRFYRIKKIRSNHSQPARSRGIFYKDKISLVYVLFSPRLLCKLRTSTSLCSELRNFTEEMLMFLFNNLHGKWWNLGRCKVKITYAFSSQQNNGFACYSSYLKNTKKALGSSAMACMVYLKVTVSCLWATLKAHLTLWVLNWILHHRTWQNFF